MNPIKLQFYSLFVLFALYLLTLLCKFSSNLFRSWKCFVSALSNGVFRKQTSVEHLKWNQIVLCCNFWSYQEYLQYTKKYVICTFLMPITYLFPLMDREAWRAAIHGVAKSRTWLSDWTELNWTDGLEKKTHSASYIYT